MPGERHQRTDLPPLEAGVRDARGGSGQAAEGTEAGVVLEVDVNVYDANSDFDTKSDFMVGSNYPNPFSLQTSVPVTLPNESSIEIEIFDASGRAVYTRTYDGREGRNDLVINAGQLDVSGVLLCRVTAEGTVKTIRMLSLK